MNSNLLTNENSQSSVAVSHPHLPAETPLPNQTDIEELIALLHSEIEETESE